MPYTPTTWVDDETPTSAANFNHLEQGVVAAAAGADGATATAGSALSVAQAAVPAFNVKNPVYGAKGDGVTDDTAAIQAAINAAAAGSGGIVVLPQGDYVTTGIVLKAGVTLTSLASIRPQISSGPYRVARLIAKAGTTGWVIDTPAGGANSCAVEGIGVACSNTAGGIRFQSSRGCQLMHVSVDSCAAQGIYVDAASLDTLIEDAVITNPFKAGVPVAAQGALEIHSTDCYIKGGEFNCGQANVTNATNLFQCAVYIPGGENFLIQVQASFADRGYYITGSNNHFALCRADHNAGHGWEITSGQNNFVGCHSVSSGQDTPNTYDAFKVSGVSNVFAGCTNHDASGSTKYSFEDLTSGGKWNAGSNQYVACTGFSATQTFSMAAFEGAAPTITSGGYRPVAGTTTPSVDNVNFVDFANYSSATNVTNFTGGFTGQRIYLLGNVNVTLVNGSTIKTSTGANKTLAANRVYSFLCSNGVWYEIGP